MPTQTDTIIVRLDKMSLMTKRPIERSHRLPGKAYVGQVTFAFTLCLADRKFSLLTEPTLHVLREALEAGVSKHDVSVPIALVMPDHMHLMLQGIDGRSDLKAAVESFKFKSGWWFYREGNGLRWQKNYYDHAPRGEGAWRRHARYIAENPVRQGLAVDVTDWPHVWTIGHDLLEVLSDAYDR